MRFLRPAIPALLLLLAACASRFDKELDRARALWESGEPEEALAAANALAAEPPEEMEDRIALADLFVTMGEAGHAIPLLEGKTLSPEGRDVLADAYLSTGDRARAGMMVREQKSAGEETARTLRIEGKLSLSRHEAANAVRYLEQSMAKDPGSAEVWVLLALAKQLGGDGKAAEEMLRQARGKFPDSPEVAFALAHVILSSRGDDPAAKEEAAGLLGPAVAKRPRRRDMRERYGLILRDLGRAVEAEKVFDALVADAPEEARYWSELGTVRMSRERFAPAAEAFRKATDLDPRPMEYPLNLGNALLEMADRAPEPKELGGKAEEAFSEAMKRAPGDPRPWVGLARSVIKQDPKDDAAAARARSLYTQALQLAPDDFDANLGVALLYYDLWSAGGTRKNEGLVKARTHFERAAAKVPPSEWPEGARHAWDEMNR